MAMSNITDKVVVITGASSGIGESAARLLAAQGVQVVLGARRSNRIDTVVQEISAAGGKASDLLPMRRSALKWKPSSKGPSTVSAASMCSSITSELCPSHRSRLLT
jgi:NAD(P)-dependent dehydrogenase (short-subunit alcohol dehydrogenase family)